MTKQNFEREYKQRETVKWRLNSLLTYLGELTQGAGIISTIGALDKPDILVYSVSGYAAGFVMKYALGNMNLEDSFFPFSRVFSPAESRWWPRRGLIDAVVDKLWPVNYKDFERRTK